MNKRFVETVEGFNTQPPTIVGGRARCALLGDMSNPPLTLVRGLLNREPLRFVYILWFGVTAMMLAGCGWWDDRSYMTVEVDPNRLHTIEPLELTPAAPGQETPPPAPADMELSLAQCRAYALENNLGLKVALLEPVIASESIAVAQAQFESYLFGSVAYSRTHTPASILQEGTVGSFLDPNQATSGDEFSVYKQENLNYSAGVNMPLRTGGALQLELPVSRYGNNDSQYTADMRFSLSQPLMRNAGVEVNTHAIRVARYQTMMSQARAKLEMINVLTYTERAYWRLYAARRQLEVRQQEYDLAESQLERARRFVAAGSVAEVEIIRAEAGVAERLEGIIIAENTLREVQRELKQLLNVPGMGVASATRLVPATLPAPMPYELDAEALVAAALDRRMEMLELELQLAIDAGNIDVARNGLLPVASLGYDLTFDGLGFSEGDAFDVLGQGDFDNHRIGLYVQVPLGNQAARGRLQQALLQRIQRLATRQQRELLINREVYSAVDNLEATWQRILASRQRAILAGRNLQAEQRQFELGLRTSTDVLATQAAYANAQSAEINALADYQIARVNLAYSVGATLAAANVEYEHPDTDISD